jgi:uncharacterized protein (TIRG00374 family)
MAIPSLTLSGETAKALFLKSRGLSGSRAFAAVFWDAFSRFIANTGMTFILLSLIFVSGILPFGKVSRNLMLLWSLGGILIAAVILRRRLSQGRFFTIAAEGMFRGNLPKEEVASFDSYVSSFALKKSSILIPLVISVSGYLWEIVQSWLMLRAVGIYTSLPIAALWHVLVNFGRVLPVPGGIGFVEAGGVFLAELFSISPASGLAFVALGRIRDLTIILVGLMVFVVKGLIGYNVFKICVSPQKKS